MREEPKERALLLGVKLNDGEDFVRSMEELANLAVACDMEVEGQITQNMERLIQPCIWEKESFRK